VSEVQITRCRRLTNFVRNRRDGHPGPSKDVVLHQYVILECSMRSLFTIYRCLSRTSDAAHPDSGAGPGVIAVEICRQFGSSGAARCRSA
jgi:hypothetical protein